MSSRVASTPYPFRLLTPKPLTSFVQTSIIRQIGTPKLKNGEGTRGNGLGNMELDG